MSWRGAWALLIATLLAVQGLITPPTTAFNGFDYDGRYYAALANPATDPSVAPIAPYCWRVLTPALVAALPFSTYTSFRLLAVVTNAASLVLVIALLRRYGLSRLAATLGLVFYATVFWTLRHSFYSVGYIDFQSLFFELAVLYLVACERYLVAALLLGLAVLQREALVALAPAVVLAHARAASAKRALPTLVVASLASVLPLMAVRKLVVPAPSDHSAIGAVLSVVFGQILNPETWGRIALEILSGTGVLPIIALARIRATRAFLASRPECAVALVLGSLMLLGGWDKARLCLFMVPPLVAIAAKHADAALEADRPRALRWLSTTLLVHMYVSGQFVVAPSEDIHALVHVPLYYKGPIVSRALVVGAFVALWTIFTLVFSPWSQQRATRARP